MSIFPGKVFININHIYKGSFLINLFLTITIFLFSFGQIGRLTPFELPIYGNIYEILLTVPLFILIEKYTNLKQFKKLPFIKPFVVFSIWLFISLLISLFWYSGLQNFIAMLYFVRLLFYFVFFIYFFNYVNKNREVIPYYISIISATALITIIFSFVQYFLYPNLGNLAYLGWDPHLYRLVGLFFDPPLTASVFFLLTLFLLITLKSSRLKIVFACSFAVLFFLTYSRGAFIALFITIAFYSFRKMKLQYVAFFVAAVILGVLLIPKNGSEGINLLRTSSINTRFIDYTKAVSIWQKSPVTGIGFNHIRFEKDSYEENPIAEKFNPSHASSSFHSSFLMILVTGGIIGLGLFLWLLRNAAGINAFAFYSVIFLSVFSLFDNLLLHPFVLFLWFTLISISNIVTHPSRT